MVQSDLEKYVGWFGSFCFHCFLFVIFYFHQFTPNIPEQPYIEITLGALPGGEGGLPTVVIPHDALPVSGENIPAGENDRIVNLPSQKTMTLADEIIRLPFQKKISSSDASPTYTSTSKISSESKMDQPRSSIAASAGDKEFVGGGTPGIGSGTGSTAGGMGTTGSGFGTGNGIGDGIGDNISVGIQWSGGGNRKLVKGELPAYPPGVNVQAQIKLKVVVAPVGDVKSATPMQKGETRLENAALKEVRLWKFEPLQNTQPQLEQTCTVTFNFRLK